MTMVNADNEELDLEMPSEPINRMPWDPDNPLLAEKCPEFVPTRYELVVLAQHFARVNIEAQWFEFCCGVSQGDSRMAAVKEIDRIRAILGAAEVEKVIDDVTDQFQEDKNPGIWDIFCNEKEIVESGAGANPARTGEVA